MITLLFAILIWWTIGIVIIGTILAVNSHRYSAPGIIPLLSASIVWPVVISRFLTDFLRRKG